MVVVDTHVLAYLFIDGSLTTAAQRLFAVDEDWCTESFALVELSNVIATYVRCGGMTAGQGRNLLTEVQAGWLTLHDVPDGAALETALEFGISAYDARFVTLAKKLKLKLVTEDARLRAAVPTWTMSLSDALR